MDLQGYRRKIDRIDGEMTRLFAERMALAEQIAAYKKAHDLPVYDAEREEEKLAEIRDKLPDELKEYGASLYRHIFELSRERQEHILPDPADVRALDRVAILARVADACDEAAGLFRNFFDVFV